MMICLFILCLISACLSENCYPQRGWDNPLFEKFCCAHGQGMSLILAQHIQDKLFAGCGRKVFVQFKCELREKLPLLTQAISQGDVSGSVILRTSGSKYIIVPAGKVEYGDKELAAKRFLSYGRLYEISLEKGAKESSKGPNAVCSAAKAAKNGFTCDYETFTLDRVYRWLVCVFE